MPQMPFPFIDADSIIAPSMSLWARALAYMFLVGGGWLVDSTIVWIMLPLTLVYLEGIVGPFEDWMLQRDFGDEYLACRKRVRKWLPYRDRTQRSRSK